jgi:hypothetical protein
MITMVDEMFDRQYRAGREQLNAAIASAFRRFARTVDSAFEALVKIEYESPWTAKRKRVRCN